MRLSLLPIALALCACSCQFRFVPADPRPAEVLESVYKVYVAGDGVDFAGKAQHFSLTATAWVAGSRGDATVLMTAGHACVTDLFLDDVLVTGVRYVLETADWESLEGASVLLDDDRVDLCALSVPGRIGRPLELASADPEYAAAGYYIGAPRGIWGGGAGGYYPTWFSGRMARVGDDRGPALGLTTAEAASGASGSPVVFGGRVAGLLNQIHPNFETRAYAVPHETIRDFLARLPRGR